MALKKSVRLARIAFTCGVLVFSCTFCLPGNAPVDNVTYEIANLKDAARGLREAAARNLGQMRDPRAVPPLISALKDGDLELRVVVIESLAELKDPRSLEPLVSLLNEKTESETSGYAILALGEFKDVRAAAALIDVLKRTTREEDAGPASSLGRIGALAVPPLIAELGNRETAVRIRVLDALGWIDDPRTIDALIGFVHDPNPAVREAAVAGLKGHWDAPGMLLAPFDVVNWFRSLDRTGTPRPKDPRVPGLLIAALKDPDAQVQSTAVEGLGQFKVSASLELLIALLHEPVKTRQAPSGRTPQPNLRKDIVIALGGIGGQRAVEALMAELNDSDEEIRSWSAWSLGRIGDPQATEALVPLLKDGNANVRREAANALAQIKDPRAAGPLIEAVRTASFAFEARLAEAKRRTGQDSGSFPAQAFAAGDPILSEGTDALRQIGEPAAPLLIEAMKSTNSAFRQRMLAALGGTKAPAAVDTIVAALNDPDRGVRSAALEALASAKDPRAETPFLRAWNDADSQAKEDAAWFLCANDAPWAARPLVAAVKDKKSGEKCLNTPGEIRTPVADALAPLLTDADHSVRAIAARTMAALLQNHLLFGRPASPTQIRAEDALRESLKERNAAVICAADNYFVGLGEDGSEDALIEALNAEGDHWMAEYLLVSGNARLEIAGRAWLKQHHLEIESHIVGPRWGQFRVGPAA